MKSKEPREPVGYCWVCERLLYRDEYKEWVFFHNLLVCRSHPGVEKWYQGSIEMSEAKLKLEIEMSEAKLKLEMVNG